LSVDVLAAVPVKDLVNAKQRLVPLLDGAQRRALARAMLEDVLAALAAALPGDVVVVTTDAEVMAVAARFGARCLVERANRGHTEAVAFAQADAVALGAARFLTIPGDVPCVTAAEIAAVCGGRDAGATFVPSMSGFGTNGVLLAPPDAMPLKFGEPSFDNHLLAARQRGLATVVRELPGLGLDIDTPEDLAQLLAHGARTRSAALVSSWHLALPDPVGPDGPTREAP
jgi:2-phospho-L-lactate/phosphoenolpyruvate guanylyltransferase